MSTTNWWKSFYEDTPFELYLARTNQAEVEATIAFLNDKLQLSPGATIFDQCCGLGGMSIPLARLGYRLVGVDLCEKYIAMAQSEAKAAQLPAEFHVADAFAFVPDAQLDAAFNWYTSFGYSAEDGENVKMLQRAFEAIKPGAWFALDFLNMPMILKSFKETMQTTLHSPDGDIIQRRDCAIDKERGTMEQRWTWTMPDGKQLHQSSTLRAYLPSEVAKLFEQAGFEQVQLFGGINGEPLSEDSGRCIILGRKPL